MQEDNWSEKLAESLRKQQEESPLPYEPGAWEAFEKRRNKIREFSFPYYRVASIAASILVFMVVGYFLTTTIFEKESSEKQPIGQVKKENSSTDQYNPDSGIKEHHEENNLSASASENKLTNDHPKSPHNDMGIRGYRSGKSELESSKEQSQIFLQPAALMEIIAAFKSYPDSAQITAEESQTLTEPDKIKSAASLMSEEEAKIKLMTQMLDGVEEKKNEVKTKKSSIFLGLGSGYANSVQNSIEASGSNLGFGLMYDLNLGKKLSIGSGLGVNYYNQTNQSQQYAQVSGLSSPIKESQKIQQLRMDIPIYVRFPLTKGNSVSLQAGFSNVLTFNQQAVETVSFTRQVSVADVSNSSANSFTLKTEQVSQTSELKVPTNKFYPFSMANLGVNILVYKSQKTNFLVMPFYHYPLQDISGTGQNPGVTGAAIKVNFGAVRK